VGGSEESFFKYYSKQFVDACVRAVADKNLASDNEELARRLTDIVNHLIVNETNDVIDQARKQLSGLANPNRTTFKDAYLTLRAEILKEIHTRFGNLFKSDLPSQLKNFIEQYKPNILPYQERRKLHLGLHKFLMSAEKDVFQIIKGLIANAEQTANLNLFTDAYVKRLSELINLWIRVSQSDIEVMQKLDQLKNLAIDLLGDQLLIEKSPAIMLPEYIERRQLPEVIMPFYFRVAQVVLQTAAQKNTYVEIAEPILPYLHKRMDNIYHDSYLLTMKVNLSSHYLRILREIEDKNLNITFEGWPIEEIQKFDNLLKYFSYTFVKKNQ